MAAVLKPAGAADTSSYIITLLVDLERRTLHIYTPLSPLCLPLSVDLGFDLSLSLRVHVWGVRTFVRVGLTAGYISRVPAPK